MDQSSFPFYHYKGVIERVVDGDTIQIRADLGFAVCHSIRVRLLGYDAPEMFSGSPEEREAGRLAKSQLEAIAPVGTEVLFITEKDHTTFNRYLANVWRLDGTPVRL